MGRANFINCMARALRKLGHEVIPLSDEYLYGIVPQYDFVNCFHDKKPINIKQIEYEFSPDFIYVEQMYFRLDVSEIECPVIYQHREYTHFPDIVDPDILLASYYWRLRAFEFYYPYEYHKIPYKDYLYVAVDSDVVTPNDEKSMPGITHIGLHIPMWQFREANGPFGDMVMESQEVFWDICVDEGYVHYVPEGLSGPDFIKMVGRCEALLYDAGRFAGLSRRLFEAMLSKTLCIVRVHTNLQANLYKEVGLTDEMCVFVRTPEDVGELNITEDQRQAMVDKAYDWVVTYHTYDVRAKRLVEIFREFEDGLRVGARFMGWGLKHKIEIQDGQPAITQ